jgi:diacylglycerol kinase
VRSFGYAFEGLGVMLRTQPNFLVHVSAAVLALALGVVLGLSPVELGLIVLTIGLVLAIECLNTALEALCDLVSPGVHPLVKRAKDVSAAAVLISAVVAVAIAILVFVPHLPAVVK